MPPGKAYMAAGSVVGFEEYIRLFGEINGVQTSYKQVSFDEMVADTPEDEDLGIEVAHMYTYADDPGYDGGMELLTAEDLRKVSFLSFSFSFPLSLFFRRGRRVRGGWLVITRLRETKRW
jgi:hypothetical protein